MQVVFVVVSIAIAFILIEVFKYRSKKREDPNKTWKSVVAKCLEELLIIFVSALVALSMTNYLENSNRKDQIIKVLDVAEEEWQGVLTQVSGGSVHAVSSMTQEGLGEEEKQEKAEYLLKMFAMGCERHVYLDLGDYLFKDSVIDLVDPKIAASIASFEDAVNRSMDAFIAYCEHRDDPEYRIDARDSMIHIGGLLRSLIHYIECEKACLRGQYSAADETQEKYRIPEETEKQYNEFIEYMKKISGYNFDGA